ncbi:hypothetical protein GCM10028812_43780 [Ancylobacter sonchi]
MRSISARRTASDAAGSAATAGTAALWASEWSGAVMFRSLDPHGRAAKRNLHGQATGWTQIRPTAIDKMVLWDHRIVRYNELFVR